MARPKVLIAGAGIAGPTLAYWLNRAGIEATLVERARGLRAGGYVIDFWGLGYDIAERMGLIDEINLIGYHVKEMRIVDDAGRRRAGVGTAEFSELTGGRYITIPRSELSRLLFKTISNSAECIFDDEIIGLREGADGMRVHLKHAGERRFDLVVGADGLHSDVRRLAFGPSDQFETHLGYMVAAFEAKGYRPRDEDVYLMYGQPGRMIGRFTLHGDSTLFLLVFATDASVPVGLAEQKVLLEEVYARCGWEGPNILAELRRTNALYLDRVSQIRMPGWAKGRVALVGDAAFCVSLLAGQGSALAMISAYVLAGELAAAEGKYRTAFARYDALLRDYIRTKQMGAERFARAFAPRTQAGLLFRDLVVKAFALPGVARLTFGKEIIDRLAIPDYDWPRLR